MTTPPAELITNGPVLTTGSSSSSSGDVVEVVLGDVVEVVLVEVGVVVEVELSVVEVVELVPGAVEVVAPFVVVDVVEPPSTEVDVDSTVVPEVWL